MNHAAERKRCHVLPIVLALTLLAFSAVSGDARSWVINVGGTGDAPTIQAGIDSSTAGDTVLVSCGTYLEYDLILKSGITVMGDSAGCAVVDANQLGRCMIADSLPGPALIKNLVLRRGFNVLGESDPHGGAVLVRASSPVFENCVFDSSNSNRSNGAGMYCTDASRPVLRNCLFADNTAEYRGGGLVCEDSSGATIIGCTFLRNHANLDGGGLLARNHSDVIVDSCSFIENSRGGSGSGAGIYCSGPTLPSIKHTLFARNHGSAIRAEGMSSPTVQGCTFFENGTGGSAFDAGGSAQIIVFHSIVANGYGGAAARVDLGSTALVRLFCSNVYGNEGGDWVGPLANQDSLNGNLNVDPGFCNPSADDWSLSATSPSASSACGRMGAFPVHCATPPPSTYYVWPDGSGVFATIQKAIDQANDGDTIVLGEGVFVGDGNRDLVVQGKGITIMSERADPGLCIIDCKGTPSDPHRAVSFLAKGENRKQSVLIGVTLQNGQADSLPFAFGGAVVLDGHNLELLHCNLQDNDAMGGGAIWMDDGFLVARGCTLRTNSGDLQAQTVSLNGDSTVIEDCVFLGNGDSASKAIVRVNRTSGLISRCIFSENDGISLQIDDLQSGFLRVRHCSFVENASSVHTVLSSAYSSSASIRFSHCFFRGNHVDGGAEIYLNKFINFIDDHSYYFDSCTVVSSFGNSPSAVRLDLIGGNVKMRGNVIAYHGSGSAVQGGLFENTIFDVLCNNFFGNPGGDWTGPVSGMLGMNGNISEDPLFCDLANGDYSLDEASPSWLAACGRMGAFDAACSFATDIAGAGEDAGTIPSVATVVIAPNPFNPATTISLGVPRRAHVRAAIHDIAGREVVVLMDEGLAPGAHDVVWRGTDASGAPVASGVYFVRSTIGDARMTRKITLVR